MTAEPTALEPHDLGAMPDGAGGDLVPGWMRRLAAIGWSVLFTIALGVVVFRVAVVLSTVTCSILFASLLAAAVAPMYGYFRETRGWGHIPAAALVSVIGLGIVVGAAGLIVFAFAP